ncbi:MAG: CHAT domain-containing protein [Aureispira sp.]
MIRIIGLLALYCCFCRASKAQVFPVCDAPAAAPIQETIKKALEAYQQKDWEPAKRYFLEAIQASQDLPCLEQTRWLQRNVLRTDFSKGDFNAFNTYYKQLLVANAQPKDKEQAIFKGRLWLLGSKAAIVQRDWETANLLAQQSATIQEAQQAWLQAIRAKTTQATVAYYQGDYQPMEAFLDQAFQWQQAHLRDNLGSLQNIMNLYGIVYYETGDYEKAAQRTLQAIETNLQQPMEQQNKQILAQSYNNLGLYYMELGDIYKAKDYCNSALQLYQQQEKYIEAATTYLNLGEFFDRQGEHEQALRYYKRGKVSLKKSKTNRKDRINRALVSLNNGIAFCAIQLKNYPIALEALTQNLKLHEQDAPKKEETLTILGDYYTQQRNYHKAINYYEKALESHQSLHGMAHPRIAQAHLSLAKSYQQQGNNSACVQQLEAAAQSLQAGDSLTLAQWGTAEIYHQVDAHAGIWLEILQQQADLLLKNNALEAAYQTAQNALLLLEAQRQQLQEKDSKLFLLQTMLPTYEVVIETALQLHQKTQERRYLETAFAASERSKALLLLDALRVEKARQFGQVPDSLLQKERYWNRAVVYHKKQLSEASRKRDKKATSLHQQRLLDAKRALEKLQEQFEKNYSDYYQLKYNDQTASIKEVQQALDKETILVEYFVGEKALYIFSITQGKTWSTILKKENSFEVAVKALRTLLANADEWEGQEEQQVAILARCARRVYQQYVEPALPATPLKRLVVIPDGLLTYIPFEVLLTQKPNYEQLQLSTLPYLLRTYSVSYHYSASLHLLTQRAVPTTGGILALASSYDPSLANDTSLSSRQQRIRRVMKDLPGTIKEVEFLEAQFVGDYYYRNAANEAQFKQQVKQNGYSVIHLAMHGLVDEGQPDYSGLLFTYSYDKEQDDMLHAYELSLLSLKTDLVVLSACETGFGRYDRGEGVVSIGRGFMYAGAPSLLLTLWPLNDAASVPMISAFYKALHEGVPKDIALQQTKLAYLRGASGLSAHPFFWAPFIQLGNAEPIILQSYWAYYKWAIVGIVWLLIGVAYGYSRYRKTTD